MPKVLTQVRDLRRACLNNGYKLIRVQTNGKKPVAKAWQSGENSALLEIVQHKALNTGLICGGLRVVDIDCDEEVVVHSILSAAQRHLPLNSLIRRRNNSPRVALIFRASLGHPGKIIAKGKTGKVEILGAGQHIVIFGKHPSGVELTWHKERSPASVPVSALPCCTEDQIGRFLTECRHLLGPDVTHPGNLEPSRERGAGDRTASPGSSEAPLPFRPAGVVGAKIANAELSAGIGPDRWFIELSPVEKSELVEECLRSLDNKQTDPREVWLKTLFAVHDAWRQGCHDARELALAWSRRGAGWTSEQDFDVAWNSCRGGTVTVGTLIYQARQLGANFSKWTAPGELVSTTETLTSTRQVHKASAGAIPANALPIVPPKRKWRHGTDVMEGAVSLLVAPGGRGKSSFLLALAMACASGKEILGEIIFGGPKPVLYINAEDPTDEIARRLRAAMSHHGIKDCDIPGLFVAGADRFSFPLLRQESSTVALHPAGWAQLEDMIWSTGATLVLIDPLVAIMGGVSINDNAAAALLMGNLTRIAATHSLGFFLAHHASKGRDTTSAEAAMGAATLMNSARIGLSIEPLSEADAFKIGVLPVDAASTFRLIGTKQNLSPPGSKDRWFQMVSVELNNAEPPVYAHGDRIGVIERFHPNSTGAAFPAAMVDAALHAIAAADPPFSIHARRGSSSASAAVADAIAPYRGGRPSNAESLAMIDHLKQIGKIRIGKIEVRRKGHGVRERDGLIAV